MIDRRMISYADHIMVINTLLDSCEMRASKLREEIKELKEQLEGSIATGDIIEALAKTYSLNDLMEYWPNE